MSEPKVYVIETFNDMLKVPTECRAAMFRDLEYALDLHQLAFGEEAETTPIGALTWTDDGSPNVTLTDSSGATLLTLKVTTE